MKRFILFCIVSIALTFSSSYSQKSDDVQRKSRLLPGTLNGFPQPFNELNNAHNAPAISTGYYFTDNNDPAGEPWRPTQRFRDIEDPATGEWFRILSGPRQVDKSFWTLNPDRGLAFFRNPSLPIENQGDFFATGVSYGTDSTDDAIAGPIPINLSSPFYFNGVRYDSFYVSTNGVVALTNRRYFYDAQGNRVIPQGETTSYDPQSAEYYNTFWPTQYASFSRVRVGDGLADQTRDDFGYIYSVLGGQAPNPHWSATTNWTSQRPGTMGGIRARGGNLESFTFDHKAALIAPFYGDLLMSQWNENDKKSDDWSKAYFNRSVARDILTIYVTNAQPYRVWVNPLGGTVNVPENLRPGDNNYINADYQVQLNRRDSSITIIYDGFEGFFRSGFRIAPAKDVFRWNTRSGLRGFARHTNFNRTSITNPPEYQQYTYYYNLHRFNADYPENSLSVKYKQWQNTLRVVDIQYRVRKQVPNGELDFTETVPSDKVNNYELLAGEPLIGAIQPVALIQNLTNDIQGVAGTNYVEQDLSFQARFRIINDATGRIVYNRLIPVDDFCLRLVDAPVSNREECTGDPEVKIRLANVTFANNTYAATYPAYPATNAYNGKTQRGIPVYRFVQVFFPSWEPNEFARDENDKLINVGRMSAFVIAVSTRPGGVRLNDTWPFDDTTSVQLFVMRRLENFEDDVTEYHIIGSTPMPSVVKWVNIDAEVANGDNVSRHPLPPRGRFAADNNSNYFRNSPVIYMNRRMLNGLDWSSGRTNFDGDELRSFPIDLRGRKGAVLSLSVQRVRNADDWPREFGDGNLVGPEPRSLLNNNVFSPFGPAQSAAQHPDAITVEFALPSSDKVSNITNLGPERWRNHPRRGGAIAETQRAALEIFGAGGYRTGFLEEDKDSSLAAENGALGHVNGLRANIFDDGFDFEYKKYFVAIPDTFINYQSEGAKNFRFRIKVRASNDQKSVVQISDDDDDFYVDNVRILYRSIEATDIEVSAVKIIWPYTLAPASQATNIPLRVTLSNNTSTSSGSYIIKVKIFKDYQPGDERNPLKRPIYCRLETINSHPNGEEIVWTMPPFDARKSGGGSYRMFGIVMVPSGDLDVRNDTTFTDINLTFGDSFAYEPADNATNEVDPQFGAGLRLQGYAYGGVGSTGGAWNNYPTVTVGQGDVGGSSSGQFAMKFNLLSADTVYGYKAFFGPRNQAPDEVSFSLYTDQADKPNALVAGSTILRDRGRDAIRSKQPEDLFWDEYVDYRLDKGVVLQPGTYWMSIAQLGQTGLELGASKYRMGMRTMMIQVPSPFNNVLVGNSGVHLMIHKEFRRNIPNSKNNANNNVFAFENTKGTGIWNEFMPTSGNPAYAHAHHFGPSNVDNSTLTLTRSTWVPLIRPFLGNKKSGSDSIFTDCIDEIPVELADFNGRVRQNGIDLFWETSSEINNAGFFVEKKVLIDEVETAWDRITFVNGQGNTQNTTYYNYTDKNVTPKATYQYKLSQVDKDGTVSCHESKIVTKTFDLDLELTIEQNTPNPMADNTNFSFRIPEANLVKLEVMDLFGNLVATIVDGQFEAGIFNHNWNGTDFNGNQLSNGTYLYRLTAGEKSVTAKLTMVK